jgi:3-dehydroshikimate dehydratase
MTPAKRAFRPGLCSVTLRHLSVDDVVRSASRAGLEVVEWGADVHVPPGDAAAARHARRATEDAGVAIGSYGSYFRAGVSDPDTWRTIVDSARLLDAPRIRVWAGNAGSTETSAEDRARVVADSRWACDVAAEHGIEVAFEYHGGTLTDDARSALDLMRDIDRPNVATYWQPPVGMLGEQSLESLRTVIDHVRAVHVFSWWPGKQRRRLEERADLWRSVFALLRQTGREFDALLEFVPDDDAALLDGEAHTLIRLTSPG